MMMYMLDSMLELGLTEKGWTSDVHRIIAERVVLCNSAITTCDALTEAIAWINAQDEDFLKKATLGNLVDAGAPII